MKPIPPKGKGNPTTGDPTTGTGNPTRAKAVSLAAFRGTRSSASSCKAAVAVTAAAERAVPTWLTIRPPTRAQRPPAMSSPRLPLSRWPTAGCRAASGRDAPPDPGHGDHDQRNRLFADQGKVAVKVGDLICWPISSHGRPMRWPCGCP